MSDLTIRAARSTDAGRTGAILSAFIDDMPWMPRIHTRAEDISFAGMMIDRGWMTVAEFDHEVIGFIARDGSEIQALYVRENMRGQGCGALLLDTMKEQSQTLNLWTFQANEGAQRFYQTHGFAELERTDGAGNDEGLPDIRYTWQRKI